jgi:hypothetical protein
VCLAEALDELVETNELPADLAHRILSNYDKSMSEALALKIRTRATIKVCVIFVVFG